MLGTTSRKIVNGTAFTPVSMTFIGLNDFVRKYFETWQSSAVNPETKEVGYYQDYVKDVIIQQVEKNAGQPPLDLKSIFDQKLPDALADKLPSVDLQ